MDKAIEDKFINLLEKIENTELKSEFLKCFLEVSSKMDELVIEKERRKLERHGCFPCVSNCVCQDNEICNGNDVDAKVEK